MGQQQILLLALGVVLVGLAIMTGVYAFSENRTKSSFDALLNDAVRIAGDAQSWKVKPYLLGGSPDLSKSKPRDFLNIRAESVNFLDLGYSGEAIGSEGYCYENLNGVYWVEGTEDDGLIIDGYSEMNGNKVRIEVTGTGESHMEIIEDESVKGWMNLSTLAETKIVAPDCVPIQG